MTCGVKEGSRVKKMKLQEGLPHDTDFRSCVKYASKQSYSVNLAGSVMPRQIHRSGNTPLKIIITEIEIIFGLQASKAQADDNHKMPPTEPMGLRQMKEQL